VIVWRVLQHDPRFLDEIVVAEYDNEREALDDAAAMNAHAAAVQVQPKLTYVVHKAEEQS